MYDIQMDDVRYTKTDLGCKGTTKIAHMQVLVAEF